MRNRLKLWCKARLSTLTRMLLGRHVEALLVRSGQHQFLVDPEDYGVGRHLRLHGSYGEDELQRIRPLIDEESDVLVVGTHVGTLAIPLAQHCRQVTAIEANPDTYRLLTANIALNDVPNIEAHNLAASDRQQKLRFLMNRSNSGGSKIAPKQSDYQYYYDKPREIDVQGDRLDDRFPGKTFDLIIMDIEGSEYFALRGMPELLSRAKTLVVEFVPHHLANVSAVDVPTFLNTLTMFDELAVPTLGVTVGREEFSQTLGELYRQGRSDDGVVFRRHAA